MIYSLYRPKAPLDTFVDSFWVTDSYVAQAPRERVLPSGTQDLIVHLGESPVRIYADEHSTEATDAPGVIVSGPRSSPLVIGTALGATVGVQFKPGGAYPFFGVPAHSLAEQTVALEALWGAPARALRERMMETSAPLERVQLLEEHLLRRLRRSSERGAALRVALDAFEEPDLTSVADALRAPEAPGARRAVADTIRRGNEGVERLPGKHGQNRRFEQVVVMVDDRPGQLGRLFGELGELDVNVEDLRLEHSPGAQFGLAEISVVPSAVRRAVEGLEARGWKIASTTND